ncbi:MAG: PAS domain S-box protein [Bacteroidia bacterium]
MLDKNGNTVYVEEISCPVYDKNEKLSCLEGFVRKNEEDNTQKIILDKQKLDFRNILENISDGIIIDNIEGDVVFANNQFLNLIGIERHELDTFVFDDYVTLEFKDEVRRRHIDRMNGKEVTNIFEYIALRKDGSKKWFEARVTTIKDGRKIIGTQSAIRDITESKLGLDLLKSSESQKTDLLNELNQRYNELMQFNYIVSHNLRAPIANIVGLADMFNMTGVQFKEKEQIILHIQNSILKIEELISDLNIILAARSDINSKREKINFTKLIRRVQSILENQIDDTKTTIYLNVSDDANEIYSIRSYIKSAFYNLINNAIKYRSSERAPRIEISIVRKSEFIEIVVKDNGIGIDLNKYGNEVFGLYKRFHTNIEGKGLGLNMTKTQIETLGGKIRIESQIGVGSTFTITLPDATK